MLFKIITPEKEVFSSEVDQVTIMTVDGEITVLPHHIPLVSLLKAGELKYKKNGQEFVLAVSGGFVEVRPDRSVVLLADTAEHPDQIDMARAEAAIQKAQKLMQGAKEKEDIDFSALQSKIEKELARLNIGKKYKKLKP